MPETSLKVALMGAGGRGRHVLRNWIDLTNCCVTAVADPAPEALEKTKEFLGDKAGDAEFTTDVEGWLKRADADVVAINSWDPQHAGNAIQCFGAGLNIHVAKPMAQSTEDADAVVRAWRESGRIGVVDMQIRTSALAEKARQLINDGAVGEVELISCFDMVGRSGAYFRQARTRRKDSVGSLTLQKGVHALDLCNYFMGDTPVRAFASGSRDVFGGDKPDGLRCPECEERGTCDYRGENATIGGIPFPVKDSLCVFAREVDVVDNLVATVDYARGGRMSYIECYFTPEYQTIIDIIGDKGAVFVRYAMDERLYLEVRKRGAASSERINIYPEKGGHGGGDHRIILKMAGALREGRQMHPDILDGRNAVALCEAIDRSIESRMPVDIPAPPSP